LARDRCGGCRGRRGGGRPDLVQPRPRLSHDPRRNPYRRGRTCA
jgi:hypothetical protein